MEQKNNKKERTPFYIFKKVGIVDKYNFFEYLWALLDGGVSIGEAILTVEDKIQSAYFREKIRQDLYTYIVSGDSLSKSMKKLPFVFSAWEVAIVESWESIGLLSWSLTRLSEELKKTYELQNKVKWALTYPIIIFLFLLAALLIVLTYVIPALVPLFEDSWTELPFATKALLATSDFITHKFWLLFIIIFAFIVFFIGYEWTEKWRANIDYFKLRIPLVGKVYKNYILARIAEQLWNLVSSWVGVVKALTLVWKSSQNKVYETLLGNVIEKVMTGEKISESIQEVDKDFDFFPKDFVQMLSVWEKTATLDEVSKKINIQYTKEVSYSLARLTKWIEPLAILIAGAFVLWFAFAIFWAILKVTETVW